jgi:hypothetical protein
VAFVRQRFIVQQNAADVAQEFFRVVRGSLLPRLHVRIGSQPCFLALVVTAGEALELAEFQVIEQILEAELVVSIEPLDCAVDVARRRQVDGARQFRIVAAKRGTTRQHCQQQGDCRNTGAENWKGGGVQGGVLQATTPQQRLS